MKENLENEKWKWYEINKFDQEKVSHLTKQYSLDQKWFNLSNVLGSKLRMNTNEAGNEAMWGTLIYRQNTEKQEEREMMHFFVTRDFLITSNLDLNLLENVDETSLRKRMNQLNTPIEGFMRLIGEILIQFIEDIDCFEERLSHFLWEIKKQNSKKMLDNIAECKHEILILNNLIIPVMEITKGIEEAFGPDIVEGLEYIRTTKRVDRSSTLLKEYVKEIEAIIALEDVVSNHKGNEIMKTLTVITTLFTPVMAWSALWGMNFDNMIELKWKYGYISALILIVISTLVLYVYLIRKGWMGDLLRVKKGKNFFD